MSINLNAMIEHVNKIIVLSCDTEWNTKHIFKGYCIIEGNGFNLILGQNGKIIIAEDSTLCILQLRDNIYSQIEKRIRSTLNFESLKEAIRGKNTTIIMEKV